MKRFRDIALTFLLCAIFGLSGTLFGVWIATEPTGTALAAEQGVANPYSDLLTPLEFINAATSPTVNLGNEMLTLPELFKGANTAVVAISTETTHRNFFGQVVTLPAAGSGFIVSADGYIVTNDHVIENANRISVMLYDGSIFPADIVGRYRAGDLAVLKIDAENLSFLSFGDSDGIEVGEQVAAIGNPLGELSNSMTVGYISGLDRDITIGGTTLTIIQTDASVNSGNSGGPLLNMKGHVIGVVTARAGGSSNGLTVEGLGFAIPSNIALETITRLIEQGAGQIQQPGQNQPPSQTPAPRPSTGGQQLPQDFEFRQDVNFGLYLTPQEINGEARLVITVEPGSGAQSAGFVTGDILVSINGFEVSTIADFINLAHRYLPFENVAVQVIRNGALITITAG
jgi:serine protease Do